MTDKRAMLASVDGKWGSCTETLWQNGLVDQSHAQRNRQAVLDVAAAGDHW